MVVPGGGEGATVPCLLRGHSPNGLDLVADEALEGPVRATCLRLVDRLQAPFGDSLVG